ncbi:hypothetical protein JMM63_07600 [Rhodovulum sulfidophilum]|uniref:Uncharacterized protein n=1 Tax=Rhodovulum sulfidophilum TaxID=35806 RepID=A0A0D6B5Z6_RHOSU|nr:hypothetical protein [Rhodovulum sulfidophilum]ANB32722.1 hypothetical protein A6W98_00675 [Rhodovulum sulfidophilum DSM 1374]ANB36571.1 hypothetical protein A6024_00660 [Rhodovulum sulfidophilum]MBK5924856.1 hypothetical protein [Rhodovulum sulfidophilum]MBL3551169.1 hypothetical protein [Rhodovulum sulfidophilum]MBL3560098.1 hypothetical protein [Rhodovulum sulfidophilum]
MLQVFVLYLVFSLGVLLGAAELERRAIVARRLGPNGRAMLVALAASALGALVVVVISTFAEGWIYMLHVLGGAILYHGFMGAFLVHGLQEVSARAAGHDIG